MLGPLLSLQHLKGAHGMGVTGSAMPLPGSQGTGKTVPVAAAPFGPFGCLWRGSPQPVTCLVHAAPCAPAHVATPAILHWCPELTHIPAEAIPL